MTPFLKQVASHYFALGDISRRCFVFPNRRSAIFFKEYLSREVREAARPVEAPEILTINDFFIRVYGGAPTDRLPLIPILYECYARLHPKAEPLDEFIYWGDVILSDFDDVDKYLVDAVDLFTNVSDLKSIRDDFSYLSKGQREAIEQFLSHFRDGSGEVKRSFLEIWNILLPLYKDFRKKLLSMDMAYEGMVYRSIAEQMESGSAVDVLKEAFPRTDGFVFAGLNALNNCEKAVLGKMRDARIAEFVWDWCGPLIKNPENKSSYFMKDNLAAFPQAFPVSGGESVPEVSVISVPSAVGQVKLLPQLLKETLPGDPVETAIVLSDEDLLSSALNSLPPEVTDVNVTMGCPMTGSAVFSLIDSILRMQLRLRIKDGHTLFFHREVGEIFSSGLLRKLLTPEEIQCAAAVKAAARYYIDIDDLHGGAALDLIFRPVVTDNAPSAETGHKLEKYLLEILSFIGSGISGKAELMLELDFTKRYYTAVSVMQEIDLELRPDAYIRTLERMVSSASVPFNGEPLKGLQIMGPLETRALDFKNLIIFSANEGSFPRRSVSSSFIPPELRKGFGLPTYEYQDAVWAYYFYRMTERAGKVIMVYDSRTEGLNTGEESRYIKQLEYHFGISVKHISAVGTSNNASKAESEIPKTEEHIRTLKEGHLSASAIKNYMVCPARFYYYSVCALSREEEVADSMDGRMIGNVFHKTMQAAYLGPEAMDPSFKMDYHGYEKNVKSPLKVVTAKYLTELISNKTAIREKIDALVCEEMKAPEVAGRNIVIADIINEYVLQTLRRDLELTGMSGRDYFDILGLEQPLSCTLEGFKFIGFIDRIDSFHPDEARIIDYKTGRVEGKNEPLIALQLFLYDLMLRGHKLLGGRRSIVNSIYSPAQLFVSLPKEEPLSIDFFESMKEKVTGILDEIQDLNVPFSRTEEVNECANCDFKNICGR
ncbi:MAG: PD-(D/E)XK nuclease family protein [Bacteroidales bacterium]|nr:PD-(D/E)XK nuclease family protein [Bacteroidales bacterium]